MSRLFQLVSQPAASPRAWNIALRTAHIVTMGVLLGGHAYDVAPEQLYPALWACLATGLALGVLETGFDTLWFHQLRGLFTIAKLLLLSLVPLFWNHRLAILVAVTVIASVGSHMPARFRYYSVLYRKVIRTGSGPGVEDGEGMSNDEA